MTEAEAEIDGPVARTAGEKLRAGRIAAGLDLADIAARTRIPQRHLEALEADEFNALPSPTYSIGFAKAHARTVGIDEVEIARDIRFQLDRTSPDGHEYQAFEPADPARVPPRLLAWTAAAIALVMMIGYGVWRSEWLEGPAARSDTAPKVAAAGAVPQPAATPGPTPAASGPVVLTAVDEVWLRITDADGERIFERQMAAGERFALPPEANDPRIRTGRPQALRVTVGGAEVAPLGAADETIDDVRISAAALAERRTSAPTPTGTAP